MRVLFYARGMESLGVGYLMSMLEHHGHTVDLVLDPGLDDNNWVRAPALRRLNRSEALLERAKAFRPQLIAVSATTNVWPYASKMAARLKEALGVPLVVGGHHAQALPEVLIAEPFVDIVCTGEGEHALLELVRRMERGEDTTRVPTLWVKRDGVVHRNEIGPLESELDRLPFPHKRLWREYGCFHDALEIVTGRGCPYDCAYCHNPLQRRLFAGCGPFLRRRSVDNVLAELKQNTARYDVRYVTIHDDNFTTDARWVDAFCERYRAEIGLPWMCYASPLALTPKLLKAMKAAGCATIFMGVDSGDERLRRELMDRPIRDEVIERQARAIHDAGIQLFASTIYGLPGESEAQMYQTLEMVGRIRPRQCSGNVFYPLPKTRLHDRAVEQGCLDAEGQEKVRQGVSSFHHESLLRHPHKETAELLARITPLYVQAPEPARRLLRWMVEQRMHRAALVAYLLLVPATMSYQGREGIKVTLSLMWKGLLGRMPPAAGAERDSGAH